MVAGLPLSADAYMANREWGSLTTMSLSAYMGGLKRDGLSIDTILSYYYSQLTASKKMRKKCKATNCMLFWNYLQLGKHDYPLIYN